MARARRQNPPPPASAPASKQMPWGRFAGGIATAITLLFALPTGWATANCYFNGKSCPYAVIGPDPEGVLRRNGLDIANRIAAGAIDNNRAAFTFAVQRSFLQDRRVDISVAFPNQEAIVIDSVRLRGDAELQALPLPQNAELLLAYVSDGWFREPEAHFLLYAVQDQVVLREHTVSCRRGVSDPTNRLNVRNIALAHDPTTIRFDLQATCDALLVNNDEIIYNPRNRYEDTSSLVGDTISLVLNNELRIERAQSIRSDEVSEDDRETRELRIASISRCRDSLRESHASQGPYPRYIGVCKSTYYDEYANLDPYSIAYFERVTSAGETTSDEVICIGSSFQAIVIQDGGSGLTWCRQIRSARGFRESGLTLHLITADGRNVEIEIVCSCLTLDIAAPRYTVETRQLSFELRGNSGRVRVDGRNYDLRQQQFDASDVAPGFNHGRYAITLTEDLTVRSFAEQPS